MNCEDVSCLFWAGLVCSTKMRPTNVVSSLCLQRLQAKKTISVKGYITYWSSTVLTGSVSRGWLSSRAILWACRFIQWLRSVSFMQLYTKRFCLNLVNVCNIVFVLVAVRLPFKMALNAWANYDLDFFLKLTYSLGHIVSNFHPCKTSTPNSFILVNPIYRMFFKIKTRFWASSMIFWLVIKLLCANAYSLSKG